MTVEDIWFGNRAVFKSIIDPPTIRVGREGYYEEFNSGNGGGQIARSAAYQQTFEFTYPWSEASDPRSVDVFADFAAGEHGDGLIYFANPMAYDRNLFPRNWASPRLCENRAWPNIGTELAEFSTTAANAHGQPARKGTWPILTLAGATPLTDERIPYALIPIPPTHTLHIGVTGFAFGDGVVVLESWKNGAVTPAASKALTWLSPTGSTRMNASVPGNLFAYAKVFLSRTSSDPSTVTPVSMMAQLSLTGKIPPLSGPHIRGHGHSGLSFDGDVAMEEWFDASPGRHYKSASVRLKEVGAWLPR